MAHVLSPPGAERSDVNPKIYLLAFPLGHMANDWAPSAIWLLAPAVALAMDLSPGEVGLLIAIHSVGASLAYLPAGVLGDRVRNRGFLLAATFWWVALGYFAAASAPGFWTLAILLGIAGLGDAAWHPIATGVMVQQMPGRRALALGVHAMGGTLAEVGAPLCVGFLLGFFDWRVVLEISAIPPLIMGVVFMRLARFVPPSQQGAIALADFRYLWELWLRPSGIRMLAIAVTYSMALMAIMSMSPLFLQNVHGHSAAETGVVFAAMLLLGSLLQPVVGRLSDITGRKHMIIGGTACAAVGAAGIALVEHPLGLIGILIVTTSLLVGVRAVILAAMVEMAGRHESTTLGLTFAIMDGVGALGAVFAGVLGGTDLRYAFVLAAVLAASAALMTAWHSFAPREAEPRPKV